jgi:hypothetical protein
LDHFEVCQQILQDAFEGKDEPLARNCTLHLCTTSWGCLLRSRRNWLQSSQIERTCPPSA